MRYWSFAIGIVIAGCFGVVTAAAQSSPLNFETPGAESPSRDAAPAAPGFLELLFGGMRPWSAPGLQAETASLPNRESRDESEGEEVEERPIDPKYLPQLVAYDGAEKAGTIIVDTPTRFLYLVLEAGKAMRYGIGVGREGFTWSGVTQVSAKREWPDWIPPDEMLARRPDLPHFMAGGPNNPLGARALYLGATLYRIHGSNEPWSIGSAVSSGCIRMRNEDVVDLYQRVRIGTKVVVN